MSSVVALLDKLEQDYEKHHRYTDDVTIIDPTADSLMWAMEVSWTAEELRDCLSFKLDAMYLRFEMDVEEMIWVGDELPRYKFIGLSNQQIKPIPSPALLTSVTTVMQPLAIVTSLGRSILNLLLPITHGHHHYDVLIQIPPKTYGFMVSTRAPFPSFSGSYLESFTSELEAFVNCNLCILNVQECSVKLHIKPTRWLEDKAVIYLKKELAIPVGRPVRTEMKENEKGIVRAIYHARLGSLELARPESVLYFTNI